MGAWTSFTLLGKGALLIYYSTVFHSFVTMYSTAMSIAGPQVSGCRRLVIVGATHPQHKAVKLMNHRRPKKRNASDRRHKPAEYEPLPPPPPEFTVVSSK